MKTLHITTAMELVADVERLNPSGVLSIEHPGVKSGDDGRAPRLYEEYGIKTTQLIQSYWDTEDPAQSQGPTRDAVDDALYFMRHHAARPGGVIVHCRKGKSRSVAMALSHFAAVNAGIAFEDLIKHIRYIRPQAAPNILIIGHADRILGYRGAFLNAVKNDTGFTATRAEANASRCRWKESHPDWETNPHRPT